MLPAPEEEHRGAENRGYEVPARNGRWCVTKRRGQHMTPYERGNREGERHPELAFEQLHAVTSVFARGFSHMIRRS